MNVKQEGQKIERRLWTAAEYVTALQEGRDFPAGTMVETPYGYMSPAEITRRTVFRSDRSATPKSWFG
jgi:hypothetical protein